MNTNLFTDNFTEKQILAIKDTINHGYWGDCTMEFLNPDGTWTEAKWTDGYITNDAHKSGHWANRRSLSGVFSGISKKICQRNLPFILHMHDWWGDGSGDVMFFNYDALDCTRDELEEWARL